MNKIFDGLTENEIKDYLLEVNAKYINFKKDNFIFFEGDALKFIYILISGIVQVEKNDISGKKIIVNRFKKPDTVFGEVYAFINDTIDYSCRVIEDARILCIPVSAFFLKGDRSIAKLTIMQNLLTVLAQKAHFLNQKLLIFSSFSLRQKIAVYLLQQSNGKAKINLQLNREALAEYLGVPRPSLSRELMSMQDDGLLKVNKDFIIANIDELENLR